MNLISCLQFPTISGLMMIVHKFAPLLLLPFFFLSLPKAVFYSKLYHVSLVPLRGSSALIKDTIQCNSLSVTIVIVSRFRAYSRFTSKGKQSQKFYLLLSPRCTSTPVQVMLDTALFFMSMPTIYGTYC